MTPAAGDGVALRTVAREWGRIGVVGFGGPPAHIALLRSLCVERRHWLSEDEFEHAVAATNMLPGPASTQLAIFCAWRLCGPAGALVGGLCFIVPGLAVILVLAAVLLAAHPPLAVEGAAAGAGAAVAAVAVHAALGLLPASWARVRGQVAPRVRFAVYLALGAVSAATIGPYLVLVLLACGTSEVVARRRPRAVGERRSGGLPLLLAGHRGVVAAAGTAGGLAALAWVALKVGALSYGGGFVIVPLMQHDAVTAYHWMTATQFLDAVALGQITPGPVVQTVAVVGYAASGVGGALLAATVAFAPSFIFVLVGGPSFDRLRRSPVAQSFLAGAGPAAIGAIAGASVPLALALEHLWQLGVLALAAGWLLGLRRSVVPAVVGAGVLGVVAALAGAPVTH